MNLKFVGVCVLICSGIILIAVNRGGGKPTKNVATSSNVDSYSHFCSYSVNEKGTPNAKFGKEALPSLVKVENTSDGKLKVINDSPSPELFQVGYDSQCLFITPKDNSALLTTIFDVPAKSSTIIKVPAKGNFIKRVERYKYP
jgi:hypothetical protein